MIGKVISLAARRERRLGLAPLGMYGKPVNRPAYDGWVEADGSLVLRFDPAVVDTGKVGGSFTSGDVPVFTIRPSGHEVRIPADVAAQWFDDMRSFGVASRQISETRRGVYEWRCAPREDGTFLVQHAHRRAVFEAFRPRGRRRHVPTGKLITDGFGHEFEERAPAIVAPDCEACRRVIRIGETAYREKRNPHGRAFGDAVLCAECIARSPGASLPKVGGAS